MNKTKKYTLLLVVICFLGIGIVSIYNTSIPQEVTKEPVVENKKQDIQEESKTTESETQKPTHEEKKKEVEVKNEITTDSKKEESSSQQPTKKEDTTKQPSQDEPKQPVQDKQTFKVSLTITALDSIIGQGEVEVEEGQSVFDALKLLTDKQGLSLSTSGFGSIIYVKGINGINEFDHGSTSGWLYHVNGTQPKIGAGSYKVKDGDCIEWLYTTSK